MNMRKKAMSRRSRTSARYFDEFRTHFWEKPENAFDRAKDHLTEEVAIKEVVHVWNHHLAPPLSRDTGIPSGGGNNTAMSSVQSPSYDYATDNQCSSNIIHYIHIWKKQFIQRSREKVVNEQETHRKNRFQTITKYQEGVVTVVDSEAIKWSEETINEKGPISKRPHENEEKITSNKIKNRNEEMTREEAGTSTSPIKVDTYGKEKFAKENTTQEEVLNSVVETSDIFGKVKFPAYYDKLKSIWHTRDAEANYFIIDMGDKEILNQVHELLSEDELLSLRERLILTDEDECISVETCRYMTLFDEIIKEECYHDNDLTEDMEGENDIITDEEEFEKVIAKMEEKVHQLDSLSEKFHYLSNYFPIPAESYDQSKMPDMFIVKSVSSHLDTITKMNGIMKNAPERTWTAHILSYLFFVTFCFIDSLQYFSCERDISTKIDIQDNGYKADGVLELHERFKRIPLFLLEVSDGPINPGKIHEDRVKLMNEGVFALNKFIMSTELPKWKVCDKLGVFLAQGFDDKVIIEQIIFIVPGLYIFSPFTFPALTIPTSNTNLGHAPRLIRTLLCLRFNIIKKIEMFKKFAKEGQQCYVNPRTKYATGITPGRLRVVTFAQFIPKVSKETSKVNSGKGRGL
ncbi:hypothetical protein RhiirA5_411303 [Rhizophagus irregularis]|uniref:Uncharacterized protein n=1 Tax=Rhizophagus irregularis TaxID=588596 RepID=A0A2N0Q1D1_9GLOM|nr:hypothetical protein RhiirA5_411303 [Rhizophagus irregularis]